MVLTDALPSLAVSLMLRLPTSALPGVPEKVLVAGSKCSQVGRAEPSARVAFRVRVSPSGSTKVPAGTVKFRLLSCDTLWAGIEPDTTGASFTFTTNRLNMVLTLALSGSVAVSLMLRLPTSALPGVPLKVPVVGLKCSQVGRAEPLVRVALRVRVSPSGSLNVPAGTVKLRLWPCHTTCSGNDMLTTGASLTLVTVRLKVVLTLFLAVSVAVTLMLRLPTSALSGVPENVPVTGSKFSQAGRAEPSARVALRVSGSLSGSVKVPAGKVKLRLLFCATLCGGTGVETTGGLPVIMVRLEVAELMASSLTVTAIVRIPPVGVFAVLTYIIALSTAWKASRVAPPVRVIVWPSLIILIPAVWAARRVLCDRVNNSLPLSCTPLSDRVMLQIRLSPSV